MKRKVISNAVMLRWRSSQNVLKIEQIKKMILSPMILLQKVQPSSFEIRRYKLVV